MAQEAKRVQVCIQLSPDLAAWLTRKAKAERTTRSALAASVLQIFRDGADSPRSADLLAELRSVRPAGGSPVTGKLTLPANAWPMLEGYFERDGRQAGRVAGELLALGMTAAEILARQEPGS